MVDPPYPPSHTDQLPGGGVRAWETAHGMGQGYPGCTCAQSRGAAKMQMGLQGCETDRLPL
eukprot:1161973-Pelagomonas_calceolata.AAC.12